MKKTEGITGKLSVSRGMRHLWSNSAHGQSAQRGLQSNQKVQISIV